jgi:hypothetical protein
VSPSLAVVRVSPGVIAAALPRVSSFKVRQPFVVGNGCRGRLGDAFEPSTQKFVGGYATRRSTARNSRPDGE